MKNEKRFRLGRELAVPYGAKSLWDINITKGGTDGNSRFYC